MIKYQKTTTIELPHGNHAKCPIYEHEGKYYIKSNKPNTTAYMPYIFNNEEYAEVEFISGYWFTK